MSRIFQILLVGLWVAVFATSASAGAMLGVHIGSENDPNWKLKLLDFEAQIGHPVAIDSDYRDWGAFPDVPRIQWDLQTGHVPMQNWRVGFQNNNPYACATAAAITAGVYDIQLKQQAAKVKALGGTIFVRFNWEMTNNKLNTCFTGFPVNQNLPLAGQEYISAWRHVVDIFRAAGALNVKWIWAPGSPAFVYDQWPYFYPGSDYVDWIAVDGYNTTLMPILFEDHPGFKEFIAQITPLGKPMMISENGAFEDPLQTPDPQAKWLRSARAFIGRHPQIQALVYWNSSCQRLPPPPYGGSGYVLSGPGLNVFKAMADNQ